MKLDPASVTEVCGQSELNLASIVAMVLSRVLRRCQLMLPMTNLVCGEMRNRWMEKVHGYTNVDSTGQPRSDHPSLQ